MVVFAIFLILAALAWLAYIYRDEIRGFLPGIKHGIAGWSTAASGGFLALLQYAQSQEGAITAILKNNPQAVPLVMFALGLVILALSWVTPRKPDA